MRIGNRGVFHGLTLRKRKDQGVSLGWTTVEGSAPLKRRKYGRAEDPDDAAEKWSS